MGSIDKYKWSLFLKGDKEAYSWIYQNNIQALYRYGLRFTGNTELIKDCVQEVFTTLYKNRKHLPVPENVKVYLFVSLKNNLIRMMQREAIYKDDPESVPFSLEPTVEEQYIEQETQDIQQARLKEILSLLTPRQQEIIYYRYIQELSMDEICSIMNLNYQSAQNLIQRSLKKIRDTHERDIKVLGTQFNVSTARMNIIASKNVRFSENRLSKITIFFPITKRRVFERKQEFVMVRLSVDECSQAAFSAKMAAKETLLSYFRRHNENFDKRITITSCHNKLFQNNLKAQQLC